MPILSVPGGFHAIRSVMRYAREIGPLNLYRAIRSKNACKACAFGTGRQRGGNRNEAGGRLEVCNKNIQAQLSDNRRAIGNAFFLETSIAELAKFSAKQLEDVGRLVTPLYKRAGDKHYSPITYDVALEKISARMKATAPERSFFYASGRSSNEAAFTLQLLARLYGTNNINNCSYFCHQASGVGLNNSIGTSTATVQFRDLELADLIFVMGANPASNHPRFLKSLMECRRRGGKVIIVNPAKEAGLVRFASPGDWRSMIKGGESIASHYLQVHAGGDLAFVQGLAKAVLSAGAEDKTFIENYCEDFALFKQQIDNLSWADIEASSGLNQSTIESIAQEYGKAERCIFSWSMGLTHHLHGVANIEAVAALALLRGMIGKPGAGLLPLRGHSNIQGTGSMGFTPALKAAVEEKLEAKLKQQLPRSAGLDTMACMEAAASGAMDFAFMLGGNLLAANPDTAYARNALNKILFKVYINTSINHSHVGGVDGEVIVLPPRARDEEHQATTQESMFNYVRLSDGGIERYPQLMSEVEMICGLGIKMIDTAVFDFSTLTDHQRIREWVGDVLPGFDKLKSIDESQEEFHIEGRTLHKPRFARESGKALFRFHELPKREHSLYLSTIRSEGQFNSIIYHEEDVYRGQERRDVVLMHPDDMKKLGLKENQRVNLQSATGILPNLLLRAFNVRPGNILTYYPEANVLIPRARDNVSQTPAFKSIPIKVMSH